MTRSFVLLAHGALGAALRAHPAGPLLFTALALAALAALAAAARGAPAPRWRAGLRVAEVVGVVCIVAGLAAHALEKQDGALLDLLHAG
jgi:hypothetical protein